MSLTHQIFDYASIFCMLSVELSIVFGLLCLLTYIAGAACRSRRMNRLRCQNVPGTVEHCERVAVTGNAPPGYVFLLRYAFNGVNYWVQQYLDGPRMAELGLSASTRQIMLKVPPALPERGQIRNTDDYGVAFFGMGVLFALVWLGFYLLIWPWLLIRGQEETTFWSLDAVQSAIGLIALSPLAAMALCIVFRACRSYLRTLVRAEAKGSVVDYRVYTPDLYKDSTQSNEMPCLVITADVSWQGAIRRIVLPVAKADEVLRNMGENPYAPSFWFTRQDWDQHLLGRDIALALDRLSATAELASRSAAKRRAAVIWCALFAFHALLLAGVWIVATA